MWEVSERASKTGHSDPLVRTLGENVGASCQNMTGEMGWKRVGAYYRVGREPWFSRVSFRAPVAEIFRWADTRTQTIGGLERTIIGLHTLHALPLSISLGHREGYRSGGCGGPLVSWGLLQMASQTEFFHR